MYGIYANIGGIGGILMVNVDPYIPYIRILWVWNGISMSQKQWYDDMGSHGLDGVLSQVMCLFHPKNRPAAKEDAFDTPRQCKR